MKKFFEKIKIIDHLKVELNIDRYKFINNLRSVVEYGGLDYFSSISELFSSDKKEYRGKIDNNGFQIKRKKRFFDISYHHAIATGRISEFEGKIIVKVEINGFNYKFIPFLIILLLFYSFFFYNIFFIEDSPPLIVILFIIIHAMLMFSIPYYMTKRSVKRLKYDLERELIFISQK